MTAAGEKRTQAKASTKPTTGRALASAGSCSDPAVHHLLAELQTARNNNDETAVGTLIAALADLGYE